MSVPNRPSFQKPSRSSSSSSSSSTAGGAASVRWNGNFSAGVSPVRGLSPVRSTFHGTARQDIDMARSHTNPLFGSRTAADISRLNNTPTKPCKDAKENREKQEPWKVPAEKAQYSGKTLCTTPGKPSRTSAAMGFTTPPKPVLKRKIFAENRELATGPPRMKEDVAARTPQKEVMAEPAIVSQTMNGESQCRAEEGSSSLSPERISGDSSKAKSPLVSIEELQKRIQKFLQDEGTSAAVSAPMSPRQSTESLPRKGSGTTTCEEGSTGVGEALFQPVVAPYSPRPEYVRARKSPTLSASMEGNSSPGRGEDGSIPERIALTYDPKNNFLSPRPQFLRYRPLRRLELLRKSAEGTLADLDLESPATDAESSRMGSEKDEKEETEPQDVSQEVQSLKSSVESPPPRCKMSSRELFKSAEMNIEIVQLRTEEPEQSISSSKPPTPVGDSGWDVPATPSELEDLNSREEGESEVEDADSNDNSSNAWYKASGVVTVVTLTALLIVASGSPAFLPTSLHQNPVSHLWKTAKATEPIRQFLQNTEGSWTEINPYPMYFALLFPDIVCVGWVHIFSLVQTADVSPVVRIGKGLWSSCMKYGLNFGRLTKESLINFKASLDEEMKYDNSHSQGVNEWDWVPDYEFVVPHDMFDPVEAYANIMARVESWEVKSFWSSLVQTHSRQPCTELFVEKPTDQILDGTTESNNCSLCLLNARCEDQGAFLCRSAPLPADRAIAGTLVSRPREDIEPNSNAPEQSEEETIIYPHELNAVSGKRVGEGSLLSVLNDQELEVGNVVCVEAENAAEAVGDVESLPSATEEEILLSPGIEVPSRSDAEKAEEEISPSLGIEVVSTEAANAAKDPGKGESFPSAGAVEEILLSPGTEIFSFEAENAAEAAGEVGSFPSAAEDEILLSPGTEVVELSDDDGEEIYLALAVGVFQELEPSMRQDHPVSFQESLEEESSLRQGEAETFPVPINPEENDIDSYMPQESSRSLTLETLVHAPAAFAIAVLAAVSVVALLVGHKINSRTGNGRCLASLKASAQRISKSSSIQPQFKVPNISQPVEDIAERDFFVEASSTEQLSSDHVKQFSILYPVTVGTPDRKLGNVIRKDWTPKKSLTPVTSGDTLQNPDTLSPGILEESSLGRFVTLVPVVHNEGTARERVQLTPVRRSSRIRTRMQNSPCTLIHSPHLCNCQESLG